MARRRLSQLDGRPIDFYLCSKCGLLFGGTDISDEDLSAMYRALDTGSYYDRVEEPSKVKAARAVSDLSSVLRGGAQIVDLGCGGGHLLRAVRDADQPWSATGYDLDPGSVELCRKAGLSATSDLAALPQADAVTMLDVAEHVKDPRAFFSQAHDLLKPGGILYLHTPRRCIWDTTALKILRVPLLRALSAMWLGTRVSWYHQRLWTDRALDRMVADSGFVVIERRQEMELSWPIDAYIDTYVKKKFRAPAIVQRGAHMIGKTVVRFRLLRNKAIVMSRRME